MSRRGIVIFWVFILTLAPITTRAEEGVPNRLAVETLIDRVSDSHWIKNSFRMSQDRHHDAYVAQDGNRVAVVVDGRKGRDYDAILSGTPIFSNDGFSVAYAARKGARWFVVEDGKEGKRYDAILENSVTFSRGDIHLAYAARSGNTSFVVLDGREGVQYGSGTFIEPESIVIDSSDSLHYLVIDDNNVYYVKEKID
ncbi:MAG TPA: hypothetical protein VFG29_14710 [Syntrophales bacterium]|nr:hypothetical protein [Syntrophales bacterium]